MPFQLIVRTQEDCKWQEIPCTREEIRRIAQQRLEGYCKNLEKNAIQIQEKKCYYKSECHRNICGRNFGSAGESKPADRDRKDKETGRNWHIWN